MLHAGGPRGVEDYRDVRPERLVGREAVQARRAPGPLDDEALRVHGEDSGVLRGGLELLESVAQHVTAMHLAAELAVGSDRRRELRGRFTQATAHAADDPRHTQRLERERQTRGGASVDSRIRAREENRRQRRHAAGRGPSDDGRDRDRDDIDRVLCMAVCPSGDVACRANDGDEEQREEMGATPFELFRRAR